MGYFMGETFDKDKCKVYKKLEAAEKAAEKIKGVVFDENGKTVKDFRVTAHTKTGELKISADKNTLTYDSDGDRNETIPDYIDGVKAVRITGKIRRVFDGSIRIRKSNSWSNDAVKGAAAFTEKAVTHLMEVDGKPMYKTLDGYFISGDPKLVEYIEE